MEKLIKSGLIGRGLILIDLPETIRRYNHCLERLGLKQTELKKFHIDGIGWSPEIAKEQCNTEYLSHGLENPLGVILTINQKDKPIYNPSHSFDRVMMRAYFREFSREIADITISSSIGLILDQRMSWYQKLDDIASVGEVTISSLPGSICRAGRKQQKLVSEFSEVDDAWMNDGLRQQIIDSAKECGDMRNRALSVEDFHFDDFDDLYTAALGGVYIFRNQGKIALIVIEDINQLNNVSEELAPYVVHIYDEDLLDRILESNIAEVNYEWYARNIDVIENRLDTLARFNISRNDPKARVDDMTPAQIAMNLKKYRDDLFELYVEGERLCYRLSKGHNIGDLSPALTRFLLHPIRTDSRYEENLTWQLICRIQQPVTDVMRLYAVNKNLFLQCYENWSESMQVWVCGMLSEFYESVRTYESPPADIATG